jgi:limonene-1,2-epoxide hydrolase
MAQRDAEALRPYLDADALYQNVGMPPQVGVEAVVSNLAQQFAAHPDTYAYEVQNLAADGDVVLTERIDVFGPADEPRHLPVMGAFVVRAGRIVRWHDYWDTGLWGRLKAGEDVSTLVPKTYT